MHKISHMVAERGCAPEHMDAVGSRRAAWHINARMEQKEKILSNKQQTEYARDYIAEVEPGLQKTCNGILAKMDQNLILSATGESKVFYFNVKGDYLAELATGDAECKAAQDARVTFAEDTKIAEKDLVVTHPICLSLTLNFSVSRYGVLQNSDEGCEMARVAFEDAISERVSLRCHSSSLSTRSQTSLL